MVHPEKFRQCKKDAGIPWQDRQGHEHEIKEDSGHYENCDFCVSLK